MPCGSESLQRDKRSLLPSVPSGLRCAFDLTTPKEFPVNRKHAWRMPGSGRSLLKTRCVCEIPFRRLLPETDQITNRVLLTGNSFGVAQVLEQEEYKNPLCPFVHSFVNFVLWIKKKMKSGANTRLHFTTLLNLTTAFAVTLCHRMLILLRLGYELP